jgi:hypothetical protein
VRDRERVQCTRPQRLRPRARRRLGQMTAFS